MRNVLKTALGAAIVLTVGAYGLAYAGPVPVGWTCVGNCGTDTVPDGVVAIPPTGDTSVEYVSTSGGVSGAGQISGAGGTDGSSLKTPLFAALAGDPLKFYFNYVTSDGAGFSDYAWAQLFDATSTLVATLFTARTTPSGDTSPGFGLPANDSTLTPASTPIIPGGPVWSELGGSSGACFDAGCGYTDWIQSTYAIASAGLYYVEFGTTNSIDTAFDSGLAIDGVTVAGVPVPTTDVPEPASMALLGAALLGFGAIRRRRQTV